MAVTAKCLAESQFVPASNLTIYSAPLQTRTIIDKFTVYNSDSGSHTITVYLLPFGGAIGASSTVLSAVSIAGGATLDSSIVQNQILNPQDSIVCVASSANYLSVRCSGREVN